MNKIILFTAVSLMTSVAFGQVEWGKFEKLIPDNARRVVELMIEKDISPCANVARQTELRVLNVAMGGVSSNTVEINFRLYGDDIEVFSEAVSTGYGNSDGYMAGAFSCAQLSKK